MKAHALRMHLKYRLDAAALMQLRMEASRLHVENEQLRDQLITAEQHADHWRQEATALHLALCEACNDVPGITQTGALVVARGTAA